MSSEDPILWGSKWDRCGALPNLMLVHHTLPIGTPVSPRGDVVSNANSTSSSSQRERRERFAVCVTPLNLNYEQPDWLLSMLEFNRLLGARHVFFYNYSIGPRSGALLDRYRRGDFSFGSPLDAGGDEQTRRPFGVSLVQWPVPVRVHQWPPKSDYEEEVHYFAQSILHKIT